MAADTSLLQKGASELQVKDLCEAQRVITYLKSTPDNGFVINAINLDSPLICSYSDASWCNAPGFRTQAGYFIVITDQDALTKSRPASVLEWKSHRLKRSVKSTLAAEAAAMESSCDVGFYIGVFLSEILHSDFKASRSDGHTLVAVRPITDCRSLYDALIKQTMSTSEKRVQISFAAIRENTASSGSDNSVRWVPTAHQLADALTKRDFKLRKIMAEFCMNPEVCLIQQLSKSDKANETSETDA